VRSTAEPQENPTYSLLYSLDSPRLNQGFQAVHQAGERLKGG
jgi:hypothetical protein